MLGNELLTHLRTDVLRDDAAPYLWSDELLYRLLSEAERQFARKTFCLMDTLEVVTVEPALNGNGDLAGTAVYDLPKETLFVWSVQIDHASRPLANWSRRLLPTISDTSLGFPQAFTTDENVKHVRFFPTPDGFGGIGGAAGPYMMLVRRSIRPTQNIDPDNEPQIPEEYHLDLCDFVAWKCLTMPDEDGQNLKSAKEYEASWNRAVSAAKGEIYYRMLGPDAYARQNWTLANTGVYGSGFSL